MSRLSIRFIHSILPTLAMLMLVSHQSDADQPHPQADPTKPVLVEVRRIWDKAEHNAFTDLLRHEDQWYCVFREGSKHVSPDGAIRVITSSDGDQWRSLSLIKHPPDDLRDAKMSVTPDGRLMINGAGMQADEEIRYHSMSWFSDDRGQTWDQGRRIGDPGFWLWRVQWRLGTAYAMGYETNINRELRTMRFYKSNDGAKFETLVDTLNVPNGSSEDRTLFLKDGSAVCLLRCETGTKNALLGRSEPPFTAWTWRELDLRIGGPNMLELPDGRVIAATRLYTPQTRTSLSWIDPDAGTITECLELPSGGDTSYAGMVLHDGLLWISYYSSHEEKACIYLAKVQISQNKSSDKRQIAPEEVVEYKTVESADGKSDGLNLHIFRPDGHQPSDRSPCIVFFFGGGWNGGTPAQFHPHCEYLASRGMVAISAEYRTKSSHGVIPKVCVFDGKSAIRWVRSHAAQLGVDPDRIAAGGGSAGGHVAAAVAACEMLEEDSADTSVSCLPNALVLFNPVFDNGPDGYSHERVKDYWRQFSPLHNVHQNMPPTIGFFGTEDKLIPVATTKAFATAMQKVGVRYDNHLYEGQPHGFFNMGRSKQGTDYFVETVREADKFLASLGFLVGEPTIEQFAKGLASSNAE